MAWEAAMPPWDWLIESEMTPTLTPAPVGPNARAAGPWIAPSPWLWTLPALSAAYGGSTARADGIAAACGSAAGGSQPSTMR